LCDHSGEYRFIDSDVNIESRRPSPGHNGEGQVDHESRMLIDGELVCADSGQAFDNINPATEEGPEEPVGL
jgi:hypothetical protein